MYEQQQQSQYPRLGKVYFDATPNVSMPITVLMNMEQLQQLMQIVSQIPPRADGKPSSVKLMAKLFPQQQPGKFDGTLTYLPPNQPPAAPAQPVYQMAYQPQQGQFQQQYAAQPSAQYPQAQPPAQQYQQPPAQYPQAQQQYAQPQQQYAQPPQQYAPQPQPPAQQPTTDWGQFQQQVAPAGALPIPQVGESPWA